MAAKTALLIIDVQNDFVGDGSLAVQDGADVIPVCNVLRAQYDFNTVVLTQDCHPADHVSFAANNGCAPFETRTITLPDGQAALQVAARTPGPLRRCLQFTPPPSCPRSIGNVASALRAGHARG